MNNSISLVIPVYNNEKTLNKYLNECHKLLLSEKNKFEIIICDDGSKDNSLNIMQSFRKKHKNISIILHKKNLGIAPTLKDLYSHANNKYVVLFSADGGWNSKDVVRLVRSIIKSDKDVVVGKRINKQYTLKRKIISFLYNFIPQILFGVNLFDVGSIKVFKLDIYKKIKIKSKSVFFEAEFLIKAIKKGYNITAISVSHNKNNKNKSGVNYKIVIDSFLDALILRINI